MKAVILAMVFISLYFAIGLAVVSLITQFITGDKYDELTYLTAALIWPVVVFACIIAVIIGYVFKFAFWLQKKFKKH